MVKRAVEMEGTVTGEHGVGLIKRDYLNHELGESTVDAMRRVSNPYSFQFSLCLDGCRMGRSNAYLTDMVTIPQLKQAFDPLCLLNCDKIVRVEKPKPGEVQPW